MQKQYTSTSATSKSAATAKAKDKLPALPASLDLISNGLVNPEADEVLKLYGFSDKQAGMIIDLIRPSRRVVQTPAITFYGPKMRDAYSLTRADRIDLTLNEHDATALLKHRRGLDGVLIFDIKKNPSSSQFASVAEVTIWCDHEVASRKYAYDVAQEIFKAGIANRETFGVSNQARIEVRDVFGQYDLSVRQGAGLRSLDDKQNPFETSKVIWSSEWMPAIVGVQSKAAVERPKFTLDPLEEEPPVELTHWVLDGILPKGGTALLSGQPKAGKTVTAEMIAARANQGRAFLGRETKKSSVYFLAFEGSRNAIRMQLNALGGEGVRLIHSAKPPTADEAVEAIFSLAVTAAPDLIIIDTLQKLLPTVELVDGVHGYKETCDYLDRLAWVARYTESCILFLHHNNRSDSLLGSQSLPAGVDTVLNLSKKRVLSSEQRIGTDLLPTRILFDREQCRIIDDLDVAAKTGISDRILAALGSESLAECDLKKLLKGDPVRTVSQGLRELVSAGKVIKMPGERKPGKRGFPAALYGRAE